MLVALSYCVAWPGPSAPTEHQFTIQPFWAKTRAQAGNGAVLIQVMANRFMDFDTLAKQSPVNSWVLCWVNHWLDGLAQRVVVNEVKSSW